MEVALLKSVPEVKAATTEEEVNILTQAVLGEVEQEGFLQQSNPLRSFS